MAEKSAYELKAGQNEVAFWSGDQEVRIRKGETYETSDPGEIQTLEGALSKSVKHAEKPKTKDAS